MATKRKSLQQLQREKLAKQRQAKAQASKPAPKPAAKPAPKALPPGKQGGPLAKSQKALPPGKKGGDLAKVQKALPGAKAQKALPAGKVGGALAKAGGLAGRMLGAAGTALAIPAAIKNIKDVAERNRRWEEYKKANGLEGRTPGRTENRTNRPGGNRTRTSNNTSSPTIPSGTRSRRGAAAATRPAPKPTSALQGRVGNANVDELRRGQEDTRKAQLERANRGNGRTQSGGSSTQSRSGGSGSSSTPRTSAPAPAAKPRFKGSAEEGRKMWAEKYSSSKYDGQAIQKEAKKLLEEMKKRRESQSSASKAGWDGNKNY